MERFEPVHKDLDIVFNREKKAPKPDKCYLCGSDKNLTRDHIPPRNLFPEPRPSNLITVKCCAKCNNDFSKDDELFRVWVAASIARSKAGDWIWDNKVLKNTLSKSPALATQLLKASHKLMLQTPDGPLEMDVLSVPRDRVENYMRRLTKGLLTRLYPDFDYENSAFDVARLDPHDKEAVAGLINAIPKLDYFHLGDGVFRVLHARVADSPSHAMFTYIFYDNVGFMVRVHPR